MSVKSLQGRQLRLTVNVSSAHARIGPQYVYQFGVVWLVTKSTRNVNFFQYNKRFQ